MFGPHRPPVLVSLAALVAANLVPLAGVLLFGWKTGDVMLLFWLENVIIGGFTLLRLIVVLFRGQWAVLFLAPFFTLHYGIFCLVHGAFLIGLFVVEAAQIGSLPPLEAMPAYLLGVVRSKADLLWPALGLVASHGVSFAVNFIGSGEYARSEARALMGAPYGRVVLLHVTILIGALAVMKLGQPVYALAVLVGLKILVDVHAHLRERLKLGPPLELKLG